MDPVSHPLATPSMDAKCAMCNKPETVEHAMSECWDPIFFWDVEQRTPKKDLPIASHGLRYISIQNEGGVPYNMILLLGLYGLWVKCMAVRS